MLRLVCMLKKFWRNSRENKRNNFHSRLKIFWEAQESMRKIVQTFNCCTDLDENSEGNRAILSMLTNPLKKFYALTKVYRICYLEDWNRMVLTDGIQHHLNISKFNQHSRSKWFKDDFVCLTYLKDYIKIS